MGVVVVGDEELDVGLATELIFTLDGEALGFHRDLEDRDLPGFR